MFVCDVSNCANRGNIFTFFRRKTGVTKTETGHQHLRRQQERDLMQKARRLMDENSVSFQMFLILLSSITLGSESQIPVFKEGQSNT